jgi:hypothetical protein
MPKQPTIAGERVMKSKKTYASVEHERLSTDGQSWKRWGPYLSERQWGTVREDYSEGGDAWNYFTHDHARSRAYRWGEDGLAGISDEQQRLCFALALWNGNDPILKERLFGLTNSEGNHGEDVKEYYFYLDSTPTHSYMKFLYKYPQAAYPYDDLVHTNSQRSREMPEYELLDTGIFKEDRYFDVFVEYAKAGPEDLLIQITATNRGPDEAELQILPTLWYRNDWAAWQARPAEKPVLKQVKGPRGTSMAAAKHSSLGEYLLYCDGSEVPLLFTDNETNNARLFPEYVNASPYLKDGIHDYVVNGKRKAVNPDHTGTKVSAQYRFMIGAGRTATAKLRLVRQEAETPTANPTKATAKTKPMNFTKRLLRLRSPKTRRTSCGRLSPACCGANNITSSTPISGWTSIARIHSRAAAATSGIAIGFTWSTAMSFRCRINGSIPGMLLGTSPFTLCRSPLWIPTLPSNRCN